MEKFADILASEFNRQLVHVDNVIKLIDEGNTIPFIARYRKEMHGTMDDQTIRELSERLIYLRNLDSRKQEIIASIDSQGKLTDELSEAIENAKTISEVEDLYRPYKPKKKTRASIARSRGLEPLAQFLLAQERNSALPMEEAEKYVNTENEVPTASDALAGARDILAEDFSDNADVRKQLRALYLADGTLQSISAKEEDSVYATYYDFSAPIKKLASHQILAINRGEREEFLKVSLIIPLERAQGILFDMFLKNNSPTTDEVKTACLDSLNRLIVPSVEREIRSFLTETADDQAIKTFGLNLKPLLMQPPVKGMVTLGLDPAYRTGCKIAVVDETGKVLDTSVIYPTPPHNKKEEAAAILNALIKKHHVQVISIGNGTASRESEQFVADLIRGTDLHYVIVSEAGASVYSASKLAAAEFPEYDVSLRSAVSIARRLQDPLAELVKIDPKAIGVGQYQHDMPQQQLDDTLSGVVEDCVNAVGVDLNTASAPLLARVSGINATVAKNIVTYREENGAFSTRKQLLKVPKLGAKAYEQCAGFLRIPESKNLLDNTGIHPESYEATETILKHCGYTISDAKAGSLSELPSKVQQQGKSSVANAAGIGIPTLEDIVKELLKPGRDPREELPKPILRSDVMAMDDLVPGMELTGTVRNVVDFGAFVDIGVHQDGLVHISRMSDHFVSKPSDVVKTGDIVKVWVVDIDKNKNRIALSMKPIQKAVNNEQN